MMFVQPGERVMSTFDVSTRNGECLMHVSNRRVMLESVRLGCVMILGYAEMGSCVLQSSGRGARGGRLALYHLNGHSATVSSRKAPEAVDAVNSALALYRASTAAASAPP
ncbi:MAG: hypothetical protein OXU86_01370 [Thaumarchaeota archaeon]|nr:hypothetical protein [Nitrososphaerota archaeon]